MQTQIDLTALTDHALATFDYSEHYEDDAFAMTFDGARIYVERKRDHFMIEVGGIIHKLPRH